MADTPPDDDSPDDPEAQFLTSLWERLDRAIELSTATDAMSHLDDVRQLCEDAAALIRSRLAQHN